MYISCPECDTKFEIEESQILKDNQKLKCSKCGHIWPYSIPQKYNQEEQKQQEPYENHNQNSKSFASSSSQGFQNGVNLPALRPVKVPYYINMFPWMISGLIIFMITIIFGHNLNVIFPLYTSDFNIKDINIEYLNNDSSISVNYKLHNTSDQHLKAPLVRTRLRDKQHHILYSIINDYSNITMLPDQIVEMNIKLPALESAPECIDIMSGNKIDFILK